MIEVSGRDVSGRGPLPAARRRAGRRRPTTRRSSRRRSSTPPRTCGAKVRATSSCSCRASARSARPATCCARASRAGPTRARVEILPLYARLSVAEQQRVFAPSRGPAHRARDQRRRDVAHGAGHPLRDRHRARARQALLAAQQDDAAADREDLAGGGATSAPAAAAASPDGICVRLYGEDDFAARPRYTDPEILRSSLAAVILRMAALDLGGVDAFPFVEPPAPRAIADGYQLLQELGAVDAERAADAARPRARAAAARSAHRPHRARGARRAAASPKCWSSRARCRCPIRASGRSSKQQAADQAHLRVPRRALRLPVAGRAVGVLRRRARARSSRTAGSVDACRAQFVSYLRLREWRDVHAQLVAELAEAGWTVDPTRCRRRSTRRATRRCTRRCSRDCSATSASKTDEGEALSGRARHPLPPASGLGAREKGAEMGARRRARRDDAPLRALRGEDRARVDRGGRRRSRDARLLRAALGREARRGRRERARAALRPDAGRAPAACRSARIDPGVGARGVHPRGARARRARDARRVPRAQPARSSPRSPSSSTRRGGRTCWSTTRRSRRSTPSACRRTSIRCATFERWRERRRAQRSAAALPDARGADAPRRGARHRGAVSGDAGDWPATTLPLKYRFAPGHPLDGLTLTVPLRAAEPARRRAPLVARAGHGPREGHAAT